MKNVTKGVNDVSVNMAYRVTKVSDAAFDDGGRCPGTCPHCGRGP